MLGTVLRERREAMGLHITDVADRAGIRRESLSRIETGKAAAGVGTIMLLTDILTIPASAWVPELLSSESRTNTLLRIARHLISRHELAEAHRVLQRVEELAGRGRPQPWYNAATMHQWGRYFYQLGNSRTALWFIRRTRWSVAHSPDPLVKSQFHYNFALALKKYGRLEGAVSEFNLAVSEAISGRSQLRNGWSRLAKANLLMELGSYREAVREYNVAAHLLTGDPWRFDCRLGEVICVWRMRSPELALKMSSTLLELSAEPGRRAKVYHLRGVLYREMDDPQNAIVELVTAMDARSADQEDTVAIAGTLAELALCHVLAGDETQAIVRCNQFKAIAGMVADRDAWVIRVIEMICGGGDAVGHLPPTTWDNHERRLAAALRLLMVRGLKLQVWKSDGQHAGVDGEQR